MPRLIMPVQASLQPQVQAAGDSVAPGPSAADLQALEGLNDIVIPEAIAYTPQTVGWYLLLAAFVLLGAWIAVVRHRRQVANRYRREALGELATIQRDLQSPEARAGALARIPVLLKRIAVSVTERAEAASLTGEAWLAFLDQAYGGNGFTTGAGRLLPTLAYQSPEQLTAVSDQQAAELLELTRTWIGAHDLTRAEGE